jgi:hypothetical protein
VRPPMIESRNIFVKKKISFLQKKKKKKTMLKLNADDCHSVRLYSTKTFRALGTLIYHKETLQALAFARACPAAARNRHRHFPTGSATGGGEGAALGSGDGEDVEEDDVDGDGDGDDDEMTGEEKARRTRWLVSGGKDGRVVVWELMDFAARRDSSAD